MKRLAAGLFISACAALIAFNTRLSEWLLRISERAHRASAAALQWAKRA